MVYHKIWFYYRIILKKVICQNHTIFEEILLYGPKWDFSPPYFGLRLLVVLSLISCSSKKEILGSNIPISFTTSCLFNPVETGISSEDSSGLGMPSRTTACSHNLTHTKFLLTGL